MARQDRLRTKNPSNFKPRFGGGLLFSRGAEPAFEFRRVALWALNGKEKETINFSKT
jgi:hypothetical protein